MKEILTIGLVGAEIIEKTSPCLLKIEEMVGDILNLCRDTFTIHFLVSDLGEFSVMATGIIKKMRKKMNINDCYVELYLPYKTAKYKENAKYYQQAFDHICFTQSEFEKKVC